jgi:SAM-dependent methyltransferase
VTKKNLKQMLKPMVRWIKLLFYSKEARRHYLVGPAHLWEMKRNFQIRFLTEMGLTPGDVLLEIGCGTLRGGIPLIAYLDPGNYYGIEVREKVLEEARKELRESGLDQKEPTLMLAPDISVLHIDTKFDVIWAFSVLIHLDDGTLTKVLEFVSRHLAPGGAFYANVNVGRREERSWQGFPVVTRLFEFYRDACATKGLDVRDIGSLRDFGHESGADSQDSQRVLKVVRRATV